MKKKLTDRDRRLALKRETVRFLSSLGPDQLAQVAGGGRPLDRTGISFSAGTKYC